MDSSGGEGRGGGGGMYQETSGSGTAREGVPLLYLLPVTGVLPDIVHRQAAVHFPSSWW